MFLGHSREPSDFFKPPRQCVNCYALVLVGWNEFVDMVVLIGDSISLICLFYSAIELFVEIQSKNVMLVIYDLFKGMWLFNLNNV